MAAKIKRDDTVVIVAGRDKGRSGKVLKVIPAEDRVVVEGCNMIKRHTRPSVSDPKGGVIEREAPLHVSNVMMRDPSTGGPTRVGFKILDDGRKVRVAKKSGVQIDV